MMSVAPQLSAAEKFDTDPKHQLPRPDTDAADMKEPVKVFILMGQSNMVGMGEVGPVTTKGTLEFLTKTEKRYPHLVDDAGGWTVRSDVRQVFVMHNRGNMQMVQNDWLTVKGKTIGPELQFGHIMGHSLEEPVLVEGVLGVVEQDRRVIGEHGYGLAKRDAVLPDVLRILLRVPIKLQLGH